CRVRSAGGEVLKGLGSFCSGEPGIASVRRRGREKCLRSWRKRQAGEHKHDKKQWSCFEFNQRIHRCYLSFSRWLTLRLRGLKEGKKTPRDRLSYRTPDSDLCIGGRVKKCPQLVNIKTVPKSLLRVPKTPSASQPRAQRNVFRCPDARPQSRLSARWYPLTGW